jgi:2-methylisocitrate lyase-like PEP mutase family enzyme
MTNSAQQADTQQAKAQSFKAMHREGALVLPNAWDAGSAAVMAAHGARAIATTSGGVSWSLGRPDGQGLSRDDMVEQVRRIAAAVDVPVTADVEGGYGPTPEDVAQTVEAVIAAGVVGVNIEDSQKPGGPLFDSQEQAERLRAARAAAQRAGLPELVINARTDVFLFGIGNPGDRLVDVIARAEEYEEAGIDSLFVPGLLDLTTLAELVKAVSVPLNVMVSPGAPTVTALAEAGVRRVSVGTAMAQSAYGLVANMTEQVLADGTYVELAEPVAFGTLNELASR